MNKMVLGILAHVDAGKTTLSEAMLYESGSIRKLGRVDKKDTFLDTNDMEKERGITIFSKIARMSLDSNEDGKENNTEIILLDTPGHVDFSAETERTLCVLDCVVLVISASSGIQSHTRTLWELVRKYKLPTFIFVNKMDQQGADKKALIGEIRKELSAFCIPFEKDHKGNLSEEAMEEISMVDEELMEQFLEKGSLEGEKIKELVAAGEIFPVLFGSALKNQGVAELLKELSEISGKINETKEVDISNELAARVYKVSRDEKKERLVHMKIISGSLKAKEKIGEEKVNQIRLYSGEKFESVAEAKKGEICVVTGLSQIKAGDCIGNDKMPYSLKLQPVLSYSLILPKEVDNAQFLPKLLELEEEHPEFQVSYSDESKEITVNVMGQVQLEILTREVKDRFGIDIEFGIGKIVYKETISNTVEGVGHFEPLRHYAEVHLLMEPLEEGSGLVFETNCSEDLLAKNWQRLIMTHLLERTHRGVLTRSPITDMKITLVAGKAHPKHTEGGDFRQATYRAIRQGLMQAEGVLLEPYYDFKLDLPETSLGRALNDMDKMGADFTIEESVNGRSIIKGRAPVSAMHNYQKELLSYTKGEGQIYYQPGGYSVCHNPQEVIESIAYNPDADTRNPSYSVFCSGGSGYQVPWDQVKDYMHVEAVLKKDRKVDISQEQGCAPSLEREDFISEEEVKEILERVSSANKKGDDFTGRHGWGRAKTIDYSANTIDTNQNYSRQSKRKLDKYILVDGYNVIFAWEDLKDIAQANIDGARWKLMDILSNYRALIEAEVILVFDAYRVSGHKTEVLDYQNIHVVYTMEAETADRYIEKFTHENSKKYDITVVTSDGMEQIIVRGEGAGLISSREFKEEVERLNSEAVARMERVKTTVGNSVIQDESTIK